MRQPSVGKFGRTAPGSTAKAVQGLASTGFWCVRHLFAGDFRAWSGGWGSTSGLGVGILASIIIASPEAFGIDAIAPPEMSLHAVLLTGHTPVP
jgi:hypothetical protein